MARIKTGVTAHRRHKKVLERTKGMRMSKGTLYRVSKEADLHAHQYAFEGRKNKKRNLRQLWITRINSGLKTYADGLKYSRFIKMLHDANVIIDRKILSELAYSDATAFKAVVAKVLSFKTTKGE